MKYLYKISFSGFAKEHVEFLFYDEKNEKAKIEARIKRTFCATAVIHEVVEYGIDVKSEINL